jgi:hypothetical protein
MLQLMPHGCGRRKGDEVAQSHLTTPAYSENPGVLDLMMAFEVGNTTRGLGYH